jgi:hypothetical protein
MAVNSVEFMGAFAIGVISSAAVLFGSYVGLKDYEKLPKRLFTLRNIAFYVLFGGSFSLIFQLVQPSFAPLQALAIGAAWPAILVGYATSQSARQIADEQIREIRELVESLSSR